MSFTFKRIDHIQLAAPRGSEDQARAFFEEILGLTVIEKPVSLKKKGGVWFQLANYQIHIGIEDPFLPARKAHPAFEIENLEGLKDHLTKHQIEFKEDYDLPGADRIYLEDPFGNRMEILEWKQ